jgi:hypothetical protein
MGMVRDFTDDARARLESDIKAIDDEGQFIFFDWVSDLFLDGDIRKYVGDIERYHEVIVDKKNITLVKLAEIWTDVHTIDDEYRTKFITLKEQAAELASKLEALVAVLSPVGPDGGSRLLDRGFSDLRAYLNANLGAIDYESEYDHKMQDALFDLLDNEFSEAAWDAIQEDEGDTNWTKHKQFLNNLFVKTQKIMGTEAAAEINFDANAFVGDYANSRGFYSHLNTKFSDHTVYLNPNVIGNDNFNGGLNDYDLVQTVFHETRHAYQHETVDDASSHPFVSSGARRAWELNFQDKKTTATDGRAAYVRQPVEFDAMSFARQFDYLKGHLPPENWLDWQQDYIDQDLWP